MDKESVFVLSPSCTWVYEEKFLVLTGHLQALRLPIRGIGSLFKELKRHLNGNTRLKEILALEIAPDDMIIDFLSRLHQASIILEISHSEDNTLTNILMLKVDTGYLSEHFCDNFHNKLGQVRLLDCSQLPNQSPLVAVDEIFLNPINKYPYTGAGFLGEKTLVEVLDETTWKIVILISDAPYTPALFWSTSHLMKRRIPHIHLSFSSSFIHLGPLVIPGETACLYCRFRREVGNLELEGDVIQAVNVKGLSIDDNMHLHMASLADSYLALELERMKQSIYYSIALSTQWDIGASPPSAISERVWKIPNCKCCQLSLTDSSNLPTMSSYSFD